MTVFKSTLVVLIVLATNIGCASQLEIRILKSGAKNWNPWRAKEPGIRPNFRGANLSGIDLRSANLDSACFHGADLRNADLRGTDLRNADFQGANLDSAYLQGANLWKADLHGADLRKADLRGANLYGANLGNADLDGAYLGEANLLVADLHGACLEGANLMNADLRGANIGKAKSLYKAKLDPDILSQIRADCPEKLATFHSAKRGWVTDKALLRQIKGPDWHGWTEEEGQGK